MLFTVDLTRLAEILLYIVINLIWVYSIMPDKLFKPCSNFAKTTNGPVGPLAGEKSVCEEEGFVGSMPAPAYGHPNENHV